MKRKNAERDPRETVKSRKEKRLQERGEKCRREADERRGTPEKRRAE